VLDFFWVRTSEYIEHQRGRRGVIVVHTFGLGGTVGVGEGEAMKE
jgi:hypothetical protein